MCSLTKGQFYRLEKRYAYHENKDCTFIHIKILLSRQREKRSHRQWSDSEPRYGW